MNFDIGKIMGRNLNPLWPIPYIHEQEKLGSIDKKIFPQYLFRKNSLWPFENLNLHVFVSWCSYFITYLYL